MRATKQNSKPQSEDFNEPTLNRKSVLAKVLTTEPKKLVIDSFVQKQNSGNPIQVDPNTWIFRHYLTVIMTIFTAKWHTIQKKPRKRFYLAFETKKTWTDILSTKQFFQAFMNNQISNTIRVRKLGAWR